MKSPLFLALLLACAAIAFLLGRELEKPDPKPAKRVSAPGDREGRTRASGELRRLRDELAALEAERERLREELASAEAPAPRPPRPIDKGWRSSDPTELQAFLRRAQDRGEAARSSIHALLAESPERILNPAPRLEDFAAIEQAPSLRSGAIAWLAAHKELDRIRGVLDGEPGVYELVAAHLALRGQDRSAIPGALDKAMRREARPLLVWRRELDRRLAGLDGALRRAFDRLMAGEAGAVDAETRGRLMQAMRSWGEAARPPGPPTLGIQGFERLIAAYKIERLLPALRLRAQTGKRDAIRCLLALPEDRALAELDALRSQVQGRWGAMADEALLIARVELGSAEALGGLAARFPALSPREKSTALRGLRRVLDDDKRPQRRARAGRALAFLRSIRAVAQGETGQGVALRDEVEALIRRARAITEAE